MIFFSFLQYIVPFLMNQGASIAYLYCLSLHELSIIVPLVNCLNFICTFLGDVVIGNTTLSFREYSTSLMLFAFYVN